MKQVQQRSKVLFFLPTVAGGGAERVVINLLRRLDRQQYQPYLVLEQKRGEYLNLVAEDVPVLSLAGDATAKKWYYIRQLSTVIAQTEADLVVSFLNQANNTALLTKLLRRSKSRLIVSVRNNLSVKYSGLPIGSKWRNKLFVRSYAWADHIISLSKGVKDDLVDNFALPPNRITPIHNPIEVAEIRSKSQVEPNWPFKQPFQQPFKTIIAVGRLVKQKGFFDLVHAFAAVRQKIPARLIILGEGYLRGELEALIKELGLIDDVAMPGFVNNPWAYMARADLFVLSSHWEGFGNVIVEAMSCGLPVISTECNYGPREIITHLEDGILIPVGDVKRMSAEMARLLTDEAEAARLSANGAQRAEDFDSTRICKRYEALFEAVLNG